MNCPHGLRYNWNPRAKAYEPATGQFGQTCPCLGSCLEHEAPARLGTPPPGYCVVCHAEPDTFTKVFVTIFACVIGAFAVIGLIVTCLAATGALR